MPPRPTRSVSAAAAAGLLTLALLGCAADGVPSSESAPVEDLGPISLGLQEVFGGQDAEEQALDQARVEEAIARCMKEQGFAYQPMPYAPSGPVHAGADVPAWGTREFAQEYGYGITTAADLGALMEPVEMPEDPNQEYVDAMSESERRTYWAALYGELATSAVDLEEGEVPRWDWTKAGCSGMAQHEVYEVATSDSSSLLAELASLYDGATADPRYLAAQQVWISCMADAGYDYSAPDEPQTALNDEFSQALDPTTGAIDPAVVDDLRDRELATALADAECRADSELDRTLGEVTARLEEEFYALHRDEVDAWFAEQQASAG